MKLHVYRKMAEDDDDDRKKKEQESAEAISGLKNLVAYFQLSRMDGLKISFFRTDFVHNDFLCFDTLSST